MKIFTINNFFYKIYFFLFNNNKRTGRNIRLVIVATNNVTDVNQPKAKVPPKPLPQKMIKPAVNTNEV
jgi:hypothetical protein